MYQKSFFLLSGVLYFVSSTVNPILYNLMSKRYRQAFKETLCCCFMKRTSKYERSLVYYHNNMKSPSSYRTYRRKPNSSYRIGEYTQTTINNDCFNNMLPEIQNCPASVRLLSDMTNSSSGSSVRFDIPNGHSNLRNKEIQHTYSGHNIDEPLMKINDSLIRHNIASNHDNRKE